LKRNHEHQQEHHQSTWSIESFDNFGDFSDLADFADNDDLGGFDDFEDLDDPMMLAQILNIAKLRSSLISTSK